MMTIDFSKPIQLKALNPESDFDEKVLGFLEEWYSPTHRVKVQTSGSTGAPKIFEVEKKRMLSSAKKTCDFLELKSRDTALLCLPVEYISGKMMVVRAIYQKLTLTTIAPTTSPLHAIEEPVDFCAMTPLQVENSLHNLKFIKKLIIGGAAVSESLKKKISRFGNQIYETFGMSETLSHIALKEISPNAANDFRLFSNIQINLDTRGCLEILAPDLYPEKITTNDLVEIISPSQFRFIGRADHVINSGGAKIFPEELESLAKKCINHELVFMGVPDESLGQKLILVVEGNPNSNIRKQVQQLDFAKSFHRPKKILFTKKIPRTPNGKVNRLILQKEIESRFLNLKKSST